MAFVFTDYSIIGLVDIFGNSLEKSYISNDSNTCQTML